MNNMFEDFLLLAVGGIVGLAAGAALASDDDDEDEETDAAAEPVDKILNSVRDAAGAALANCETDEEREEVRREIRQAIENLKESLAAHSAVTAEAEEVDAEVVDVDTDTKEKPSGKNDNMYTLRQLMEKLNAMLDETMTDVKPKEGGAQM